jgi:Flp pilus assembly protein TadB
VRTVSASGRRGASFRARRSTIAADAVALTADLLAMALVAGLTPFLALDLVARHGPAPVSGRIGSALGATEGGLRLAEALDAEAACSLALAPVLALLAASERSGVPVAAPLGRLAGQIRAQERRRAMARARTVPVRLLFPLVFLVLPAFLLLTVAPVVLASLTN